MHAPSYRTPVVKLLANHYIHVAGPDHTTDKGEFVPALNYATYSEGVQRIGHISTYP